MTWLQTLSLWATGGVSAGGGFFAIRWLFEYVGGRMDKRAKALDDGNDKLIKHLQDQISTLNERLNQAFQRIDAVEEELAECRDQHAEAKGEIARLQGVMQGYGDARDEAARIVAVERLHDRGGKS